MDIQPIGVRVRRELAAAAGIAVTALKDDQTTAEHGLDSLDEYELMMTLEDEFDISIPDRDLDKLKMQPVREWVQYIEARKGAMHS